MGAHETAAEEVLRAASAEVSTSSAKRRLRLFRHTLLPLVAKASGTRPIIASALPSLDRPLAVVRGFGLSLSLVRLRSFPCSYFLQRGALRSDELLTVDSLRFARAGSPRLP